MKREDDQDLWDLLGRTAQPELSPFFARNMLRQIRSEEADRPKRIRKWLTWRRLVPASVLAVAVAWTMIAVYHPVSQKSSDSEPDLVAKIDPQDYEVVADLDELLAVEENSLWDENPTL
jgi:hypothetical protein